MSSKNLARIVLVVAAICTVACGTNHSGSVTQPAANATTFHVTDSANRILAGVSVCDAKNCATTSASGDAPLDLAIGTKVFITFTVPNQPIPFSDLYTATGQTINVSLRLQ